MNTDKSHIHQNPFQQLAREHIPPPKLKHKILTSTKLAYFMLATVDLFSVKATDTIFELIKNSGSDSDF